MCGIIGAISQRDIVQVLLEGLRRLEYRGYDSAGIAVLNEKNCMQYLRIEGKVAALAEVLLQTTLLGRIGIAHTRWATHGKVAEKNAHPQISNSELALVHNGIIENHEALRCELEGLGYLFTSETDTEVAAHLVHYYYQQHENLLAAVQEAAQKMTGAFSLCVMHEKCLAELVGIRKGSQMVLGLGIDEQFIASDPLAFAGFAKSIIYLEEGESVHLKGGKIYLFDTNGVQINREPQEFKGESLALSKGPYRHFMLKEINYQPEALTATLDGRIANQDILKASFGTMASCLLGKIKQIQIVACGTSYHAGLLARYWLESLTGLPTQVEVASEYRYRDVLVAKNTLFIAVSQSGETADTLAALHKAKRLPYLASLAICNVASSTLVRAADCAFLTRAGVEIGVASTKAFTTQLAAFLMLSVALCKDERANDVLLQLQSLPFFCTAALKMSAAIESLSSLFVNKSNALFLGRGTQYPVALEGALKLKEVSYIHAEAYPAGELKHGPLALVDKDMPVIAVAPNDKLLDKLKSNLQEVHARGGQLIVFVDDSQVWEATDAHLIRVPACGSWIAPIVYTIPLQLLAYHVAVAKGTDVDQPRNLAKSVTVE